MLVTYHVNSDMRMQLTVEYPGNATDMASLPAFGIEWTLPVQYTNLRFFGTGPEETYLDRKHAKLGVWSTNAFRGSCAVPHAAGNRQP